jgi:hypothetical protein
VDPGGRGPNAQRNSVKPHEALHPETRQHVAGGHGKHGSASDKMSFAEDTAQRTGRDRRTVERDATRGERIGEEVLADIRGTALDKGATSMPWRARPTRQPCEAPTFRGKACPIAERHSRIDPPGGARPLASTDGY